MSAVAHGIADHGSEACGLLAFVLEVLVIRDMRSIASEENFMQMRPQAA